MIHIVLDTNIYRQHIYMQKAAFTSLTRLCSEGIVRIYIPSIVKDELASQIPKISEPFKRTTKGIKETKRLKHSSSDFSKLEKIESDIQRMKKRFEKRIEHNFEKWTEEVNAVFYEIKKDHAKNVFDGYFKGEPPFKEKKNRNDIPDAFIWESIKDILKKYKKIHVVANDGKLHECCNETSNIHAYNSLEEFIRSPELQEQIADSFSIKYSDQIIELLSSNEDVFIDAVQRTYLDMLVGKSFYDEIILDDNSEWGWQAK